MGELGLRVSKQPPGLRGRTWGFTQVYPVHPAGQNCLSCGQRLKGSGAGTDTGEGVYTAGLAEGFPSDPGHAVPSLGLSFPICKMVTMDPGDADGSELACWLRDGGVAKPYKLRPDQALRRRCFEG